MKNNKVILHGECMIFRSKLPDNATPVASDNKDYMVIANSEVTGNHHVVDLLDGVDFFRGDSGTLFMKNSVPTKVRCVLTERHSDVVLEPNVWEFGNQQEYDHIVDELVKVRD